MDLDVASSFNFYKRFIVGNSIDKRKIYHQYGFTMEGGIHPKDWEVFAAILLKDRAKQGNGADLQMHEVKSALIGGSFEYQYHKKNSLEKLDGDKKVDPLFISRDETCLNIKVYLVKKESMIPELKKWEPELVDNYQEDKRQRFRKSVSYSFIVKHGSVLMEIKKVIYGGLAKPQKNNRSMSAQASNSFPGNPVIFLLNQHYL